MLSKLLIGRELSMPREVLETPLVSGTDKETQLVWKPMPP
jgi:hypothetical protein